MIKITSGLSERQVLQRLGAKGANLTLVISTSHKNEPLLVTISGAKGPLKTWKKRKIGMNTGRNQTLALKQIPAGGPYTLTLQTGKEATSIKSFFVGDVWILAGQSNMEGAANREGAAKPHPLISAFSMRREWRRAQEPLHLCGESPDPCHNNQNQCSPEYSESYRRICRRGVGPSLHFARHMLERSGVPQALICTAHGGTSMAQWDPKRKSLGGESLYASMLMSVQATGQPVAGVLWYQGESDASEAASMEYTTRMKELVAASRRDLKQPALPWMIAQIGCVYGNRQEPVKYWNSIQEQQRLLPRQIRNLEMVTAIDLSMDDHIHVGGAGVTVLADRFAEVAENLVYRKGRGEGTPQPHRIHSWSKDGALLVTVSCKGVKGGLRAAGLPRGFEILDRDGNPLPHIFKTIVKGNDIVLFLTQWLPEDTQLCYGHGAAPVCNITDGRGHALPVMGPQKIAPAAAWTPFITEWKVTPVISAPRSSLAGLKSGDLDFSATETRNYADGFVNEWPRWERKSGQGYFTSLMELSEAMNLEVWMGYDGPFRLWIDDKPVYTDISGINPCIRDEFSQRVKLGKGKHNLRVAMDLNNGKAWGFFLRFKRLDVTHAQLASGDYARPAFYAE